MKHLLAGMFMAVAIFLLAKFGSGLILLALAWMIPVMIGLFIIARAELKEDDNEEVH